MIRLLTALALVVVTKDVADTKERECRFVLLLPDAALVVQLDGAERTVDIFGITVPQPPPALYRDIAGTRIHTRGRPLRCEVRGEGPADRVRARVFYFAWQDKSGDVWEDLALALLDQGVARVSREAFPERTEYLRHERR